MLVVALRDHLTTSHHQLKAQHCHHRHFHQLHSFSFQSMLKSSEQSQKTHPC